MIHWSSPFECHINNVLGLTDSVIFLNPLTVGTRVIDMVENYMIGFFENLRFFLLYRVSLRRYLVTVLSVTPRFIAVFAIEGKCPMSSLSEL